MHAEKVRAGFVYCLPLLIGGGMAIGAILGLSLASETLSRPGSAGDVAGALGVLMIGVTFLGGTTLAGLSVILQRLCSARPLERFPSRLALSFVGGAGIGGLSVLEGIPWSFFSLALQVGLPILLSLPTPVRRVSRGRSA